MIPSGPEDRHQVPLGAQTMFFTKGPSLTQTVVSLLSDLTRFNKIAIQGSPQMAVDKEAISLSRVYSYYSKRNLPLFYV